jgi:8-oxo-dGTP pyrophosphatase MutT (NUDIX family)
MTVDELISIWSLDFKQMWQRIWIDNSIPELYKKKYLKFYQSFIKYDQGKNLRKMIQQVRNYTSLSWEIPKGRPINSNEIDIVCAIREVKEETGLDKTNYTFLPNVKRYVNYVSFGTRYICTYYIAIINSNIKYYNTSVFKNNNIISEVSETKWYDIDKIRLIDDNKKHLEKLIKPAFKLVKKYVNKKWMNRMRNRIILPSTLANI